MKDEVKIEKFIVIFQRQFCPRGKSAMRFITLCDAPTHERSDHKSKTLPRFKIRDSASEQV